MVAILCTILIPFKDHKIIHFASLTHTNTNPLLAFKII